MDKTLFILAGYRGVGKTTLCVSALEKKLSLFGLEFDPLFQLTQVPPKYPEWELSLEQLLEARTWVGDSNLNALGALKGIPDHLVMHIDLLSLLSNRHCYPDHTLPYSLSDDQHQSFDHLADAAINESAMLLYLSNDFFKQFTNIVINTLYARWNVTALQYQKRKGPSFSPHLFPDFCFDLNQPGEKNYESIYRTWLAVSENVLRPKEALVSKFQDGQYLIKQIT